MASPRFVRGRRSAALTLLAAAFVALPASASVADPGAPAGGGPASPPSSVSMTLDQQCTAHGATYSVALHNKGTQAASASLSWGDVQTPVVEIAAGETRTRELPVKPGTKVEALVQDERGGLPQHLSHTVKARDCSSTGTGAPLPKPAVDYRLIDSCGPEGAHAAVALLKNTGKVPATVTLSSGSHRLPPIELAAGESRERTLPSFVGHDAKVELAAVTAGAEKGRTALQLRKSASTRGHTCTFRAPGESSAHGNAAGGAPGQLGTGLLRLTTFSDGTGSVSGKVTADAGGAGLPDICVHLSSQDDYGYGTTTLADGTYSLTGLAARTYHVWFQDCGTTGTGYITEYYGNTRDWDLATTVTVGTTAITGINAGLALGGAISGTVTAQTGGAVLVDICVDVESATANYYDEAYTAADGTYSLRGIPAATDLVASFYDCNTGDYLSEYWNNVATEASATRLSVSAGVLRTGISPSLALGGRISGTVTAHVGGAPLADMCVRAETADDVYPSSWTASDGTYVLRGLPTGQYVVGFYDCDQGLYASEFYNDKTTWAAANPVSVTAPNQTSAINASLDLKGKITGTVTADVGGAPIANVCVEAYTADGYDVDTQTAADGTYALTAESGSYTVVFSDCEAHVYLSEFWNNVRNEANAAPVTVTSPNTTANVNAALARGASITGTVTAQAGGAPLSDVCVGAWSESTEGEGSGYTQADGTYTITGLPTASDYVIDFYDCGAGTYAPEKWNDQAVWTSGTPLSLTAPANTANINAALALAGAISGTVTAQATGAPLTDMCVQVLGGPNRDYFVAEEITSADGTYVIGRLPSGTYSVKFQDCDSGAYAGEFYDNVIAPASATTVTVTAPNTRTGVNAQLAAAGTIHGTVTDASTGLPLDNVCVTAWTSDHAWQGYGYTSSAGTYTVTGLPAGSYVVNYEYCEFDPVGYQSEFYDNVLTEAAATKVNVAAGVATNNVNADLAKNGAVPINHAGLLTPVAPARLLDTRSAIGVPGTTPVPAGGKVDLQVSGRGGVPATGAGAVVLNVTVTAPTGGGFITVFPSDVAMPTASNLNFSPGQTIPNHVTVKLSVGGKVTLYNGSGGTVHLIADVAGWYVAGTPSEAGALTAVTPARILDTRIGIGTGVTNPLAPGQKLRVQVAGRGGVPAGTTASAVALNVTVTGPTGAGFITAYPALTTAPTASNLNFSPGQTIPNAVTVKLGTDGYIELYNGSGGTVHLIADVAGWFRSGTPTAAGAFTPLAPSRLVDTRSSQAVASGQSLVLQVAGAGGVPAGTTAKAVVLNVTVTDSKTPGFISVYPEGVAPNASNLNFWTGQTIPNLVTVKVGSDGKVRLFNGSGGTVQLIADVAGWYL